MSELTVNSNKIRLFIKPWCGWCQQAVEWLDARGVEYDQIDVTASEADFAEMIRLSGQELAPVIEVNGKVLADFDTAQLAVFWKEMFPATKTK